ncbi:MAG: hypothetical protein ACR2PH_03190 [Desulfobulbia bacterium]
MGCRSRKEKFGLLNRYRLLLCSACRLRVSIPVLLAVSAVFTCCFTESANAAIKCRGMFQVIKGHGLISTPYCQDKWLASYVRRYGVKVSFDSIRKNPAKKDEICRFLRHDPQIRSVCGVVADDDFSTRRF